MDEKKEIKTLKQLNETYRGEKIMITVCEDWVGIYEIGSAKARIYNFEKEIDA